MNTYHRYFYPMEANNVEKDEDEEALQYIKEIVCIALSMLHIFSFISYNLYFCIEALFFFW